MATLKQLVDFANKYQIPQSELCFYGEHDVVYLEIPEGLFPDPENITDEFKNQLEETYNIYEVEGYWGFYT